MGLFGGKNYMGQPRQPFGKKISKISYPSHRSISLTYKSKLVKSVLVRNHIGIYILTHIDQDSCIPYNLCMIYKYKHNINFCSCIYCLSSVLPRYLRYSFLWQPSLKQLSKYFHSQPIRHERSQKRSIQNKMR